MDNEDYEQLCAEIGCALDRAVRNNHPDIYPEFFGVETQDGYHLSADWWINDDDIPRHDPNPRYFRITRQGEHLEAVEVKESPRHEYPLCGHCAKFHDVHEGCVMDLKCSQCGGYHADGSLHSEDYGSD